MTKIKSAKITIGISIGDPNGIGLEVVLKTLVDNRILELFTPVLFGSKKLILGQTKELHLQDLRFNFIQSVADVKSAQINVISVCDEAFTSSFGKEASDAGRIAFESLQAATASLKLKEIEILNLQEKVKLMNISKSVDVSKQDVKETKLKINEYVREIDKCIALLNK